LFFFLLLLYLDNLIGFGILKRKF